MTNKRPNKIQPCKCPKCGNVIEDYLDGYQDMYFTSTDNIAVDYACVCPSCETEFIYTEEYEFTTGYVSYINE